MSEQSVSEMVAQLERDFAICEQVVVSVCEAFGLPASASPFAIDNAIDTAGERAEALEGALQQIQFIVHRPYSHEWTAQNACRAIQRIVERLLPPYLPPLEPPQATGLVR